MEHIWAPWRIQYILGEKPEGCVLCNKPAENTDVQNYIVFRGKTNSISPSTANGTPNTVSAAACKSASERTDDGASRHWASKMSNVRS